MIETSIASYIVTVAIGFGVGEGELLSRYRDAPLKVARRVNALAYAVINALLAGGALLLAHTFAWHFGFSASHTTQLAAVQVVVSGTGAMAVIRSSFAKVKVNGNDISIGPAVFVEAFLGAIDRSVDRERALEREVIVADVMTGTDFEKVATELPPYCFQLLQNSTSDEETAVGRAVKDLRQDESISGDVKVRLVGLQLLGVVGEDVLRRAVTSLGSTLLASAAPPEQTQATQALPRLLRFASGVPVPELAPHGDVAPPPASKSGPTPAKKRIPRGPAAK